MAKRKTRRNVPLPPIYVAEWIKLDGRSDAEIAQACDVDRATIWKWKVRQIARPQEANRARLARALGINYLDFYRLPSRPSPDAVLREAPDEVAALVAEMAKLLLPKRPA